MGLKLFGRDFDSIGSSSSDLLLKTKGQVKVQWGNKFIDLLKDGKINYQGNLCNGVFHGFGVYTFGASEYMGDFSSGLPEGKGTYKSKNGWTYEGNFKTLF